MRSVSGTPPRTHLCRLLYGALPRHRIVVGPGLCATVAASQHANRVAPPTLGWGGPRVLVAEGKKYSGFGPQFSGSDGVVVPNITGDLQRYDLLRPLEKRALEAAWKRVSLFGIKGHRRPQWSLCGSMAVSECRFCSVTRGIFLLCLFHPARALTWRNTSKEADWRRFGGCVGQQVK